VSVIEQGRWVNVQYVYDGDTFRTRQGERVRLLGINTPEVAHNDEPGQPFGIEARDRLKTLIEGKSVQLRLDSDHKDNYKRTLAQVFLRDGSWINSQLVDEGMAHVYTFVPNFRWAEALLQAEKRARQKKLGIWKSERFELLDAKKVTHQHIGQFRVVRGKVKHPGRWKFQLGKLHISIPKKYRPGFEKGLKLNSSRIVIVHGTIRVSSQGRLFLALHSPYDIEMSAPGIMP